MFFSVAVHAARYRPDLPHPVPTAEPQRLRTRLPLAMSMVGWERAPAHLFASGHTDDSDANAVLFSEDDLTISRGGTPTVTEQIYLQIPIRLTRTGVSDDLEVDLWDRGTVPGVPWAAHRNRRISADRCPIPRWRPGRSR